MKIGTVPVNGHPPHLHVLCRTLEQLEAALACGVSSVIGEFRELDQSRDAVPMAHGSGAKIALAAPRIHKPADSAAWERLAGDQADGILVRNLASLAFFCRAGIPVVADFSLGAVNELSVAWLCRQGAGASPRPMI